MLVSALVCLVRTEDVDIIIAIVIGIIIAAAIVIGMCLRA